VLLDYALLTAPTPLQAATSATLTFAISNGGRQAVTVTSIVITLPIGTNAKDLTAVTGFQSAASSGWNVAQSGGALTLTPIGSGVVTINAITVTIANVAVNDQPGTADIFISETAALGSGAPTTSSTSRPAAKFPVQFSVSDLTVTPTQVPYGGSASVMWTGTQAQAATYTLDWPQAPTHPVNVTNVGPHPAPNLTIFPTVFTLTVSLELPGHDQKVTLQKQAMVTQTPSVDITRFTSSRLTVGPGQTFDLKWQVQLATSLTLGLENAPSAADVNVLGLSGCTVSGAGTGLVLTDATGKQIGTLSPSPFPTQLMFQLTAGDGSSFVQKTVEVDVLPPAIDKYTVKPSFRIAGNRLTFVFLFTWSTRHAASIAIPFAPSGLPTSGSTSIDWPPGAAQDDPIITVNWPLTATGYAGLTATLQPEVIT
jgi:hypothetical protein